jgi:hypothetical protein
MIPLLGLGDLIFYNLMILFILSPLSSIEMKICVGIVCITFSAYTILIDLLIKDFN